MAKIKVFIKRPDELIGHSTFISDTLKNLQNMVDGYIETVTIGKLVIICNEEGRLMNLPYNCTIRGIDFVGTIIVAGIDEDEFADVPIDFDEWKEFLRKEGWTEWQKKQMN